MFWGIIKFNRFCEKKRKPLDFTKNGKNAEMAEIAEMAKVAITQLPLLNVTYLYLIKWFYITLRFENCEV